MLGGPPFRTTVAVAVALAASGMLFSASGVEGARSDYDASQLIAFTRADGIYAIRADGSGERSLRRGGAAAGVGGLAWSPDGRRLAFTTSAGEIWAMDADGNHLVRLVGPDRIPAKAIGSLTWSPLGRRIAFTGIGAKDPDIWVVNADGTNPHRLLRTPHRSEFQVDWSPYGDRIAFADPRGYFFHLHVMGANGRHVRTINPGGMFQAAMPRWSLSGRWLVFMAWPGSASVQEAEIWITDARGSQPRRLTHNGVVDSDPSWSSDGGRIVFLRGRGEETVWVAPEKRGPGEIYVMNWDGTGVTRLTHNRLGEGSPVWQPVSTS